MRFIVSFVRMVTDKPWWVCGIINLLFRKAHRSIRIIVYHTTNTINTAVDRLFSWNNLARRGTASWKAELTTTRVTRGTWMVWAGWDYIFGGHLGPSWPIWPICGVGEKSSQWRDGEYWRPSRKHIKISLPNAMTITTNYRTIHAGPCIRIYLYAYLWENPAPKDPCWKCNRHRNVNFDVLQCRIKTYQNYHEKGTYKRQKFEFWGRRLPPFVQLKASLHDLFDRWDGRNRKANRIPPSVKRWTIRYELSHNSID